MEKTILLKDLKF